MTITGSVMTLSAIRFGLDDGIANMVRMAMDEAAAKAKQQAALAAS